MLHKVMAAQVSLDGRLLPTGTTEPMAAVSILLPSGVVIMRSEPLDVMTILSSVARAGAFRGSSHWPVASIHATSDYVLSLGLTK